HTQEQVRGVFHDVDRLAENLVVRGGRVFLVGTAGGDDVAHELIVGPVAGDLLANPAPERCRPLGAEELAVYLKQVGPLVGPVLDVVVAADESIDQFGPLGAAIAGISQEGSYVLGFWRQAGQIEIDAADEVGIAAYIGGQDLHSLPLGRGQFVDAVVNRRLFPLKAAAIAHHGQRGRGIGALITGQD